MIGVRRITGILVIMCLCSGSQLYELSTYCSDLDLSETLSYTQASPPTTVNYFSVDSVKGYINLVASLDYETATTASYYVIVADNGCECIDL